VTKRRAGNRRSKIAAPVCPHCSEPTECVSGRYIYRHARGTLARKFFWICDECQAWVGCHGMTKRPLGTPANAELRAARSTLQVRRLDPIWKGAATMRGLYTPENAKAAAIITSAARTRTYAWLAEQLGIPPERAHVGEFSLEQCRAAWVLLKGVGYQQIREWAKSRPKKETRP
jgi:hypothetical protein